MEGAEGAGWARADETGIDVGSVTLDTPLGKNDYGQRQRERGREGGRGGWSKKRRSDGGMDPHRHTRRHRQIKQM